MECTDRYGNAARSGKIYVDAERKLEFLTVGDYGKENNIKADFLGLHKEINGVRNTEVDLTDKWVATISTQKGCQMKCKFCDCPRYGFYGNATIDDMRYEIETILSGEEVTHTDRFNVHFARMGEPTFNRDVLTFTEYHLRDIVRKYIDARTIHPVVSTMLPKSNPTLEDHIIELCTVAKLDCNLALTVPIEKFIVKITPIHETNSAVTNGFNVTTSYTDYDVYRKFEQPLVAEGWDVIVFVPSKEEDSDRITCGNALIAYQNNN